MPRRNALAAACRTYGAGAVTLLLVWIILAQLQLVRGAAGAHTFAGGAAQHAGDPDALIATLATPSDLPAFALRKLRIPVQAAILPGYGEDCRYLGTGTVALFDPATALVLGGAIVVAALTPRRYLHLLALVWAGLVVAGAALLPQNANLHRYYTGLPIFFLLIALAADVLWRRARSDGARWRLVGAFAAVLAYATCANVHHLHWELYPNPIYRDAWRWPRTEIIAWIRQRPTTDRVCVVTTAAAEIQEPTRWRPTTVG